MNYIFLCGLLIARAQGLDPILEENPKRTFPARRAIDGSRGRAFYVPEESDAFDIYGDGGHYDPYSDTTDFSDIRRNVPGEPGIDYPSYMRIPQTSFQCQGDFRGYYADEEAGCQLFHVCDGNFLVSSFLCPIGSIFSQKLLTCDWWNKVDCSATRNFLTSNRASLVTQADDDEILRKAYEMTSLQTSQTAIVDPKDRTGQAIQRTAQVINDLQTGTNNYGDYADDVSDVQYKYSSRYSSTNHRDREIDYHPMVAQENQQNPKIKVHTIGQDHKNDNNRFNDIRPSYAPTVPTVTTTTRRFYSPTVPTTSSRPMARHRYDLEYESSDHLYSARGRGQETLATKATKPTIDTTTSVVVEVPPILSETSESRLDLVVKNSGKNSTENPEIVSEKAEMVTQFSTIEFQSLFSGENHTFGIDGDRNDGLVELPSSDIIPPFFYYSNVDQHEAIRAGKREETNSSNGFVINVQATEAPLFNSSANETQQNYADNEVIAFSTTLHPPLLIKMQNPSIEAETKIDNEIVQPSKLFLPPFLDSDTENSTDVSRDNEPEIVTATSDKLEDSGEAESAPFHISLSVNESEEIDTQDELVVSSSAQHEAADIKTTEIVKSSQPTTETSDLQTTVIGDSDTAGSRTRVVNLAALNKLESREAVGSISALRSADQYPRPFSLEPRRGIEVIPSTTPFSEKSEINQNENESKDEAVDQLAQTFGRLAYKTETPLIFDLPHVTRTIDFRTGRKLAKPREETSEGEVTEKDDSAIETELVPSIGFSLNSAAEREEYAEAVLRGLFTDIPITSINKSTDDPES